MIGIFDSGLGGLTVYKEIKNLLPQYDYLYLGDTLHVPYGNRSDEAVFDLTKKACDFLFDNGCKLIIVACNTATAKALRKLQQEYLVARVSKGEQGEAGGKERILGVVRPIAEYFSEKDHCDLGVIGTRGTINSQVYIKELKKLGFQGQIFQQATPLLVPLIEENYKDKIVLKKILRKYLSVLKFKKVSFLILGCTHYPLILKLIRQVMGKHCQVLNPAKIVADSLKQYLDKHSEIEKQLSKTGTSEFLVTDLNENFQKTANTFLGQKVNIKKIKF